MRPARAPLNPGSAGSLATFLTIGAGSFTVYSRGEDIISLSSLGEHNEGKMKPGLRTSAQAAVLRAVHDHPSMTRAQVAAEIGIPSGFAAETVARLVSAELIAERPAPATGRRGRPTTTLGAHPDGPLVAAAAIGQETWQVAAVELGGTMMAGTARTHDGDQDRVLGAVAAGLARIRDRFGARVRAAAVAVPGTVAGSRLVLAPRLSWHGGDLSGLWPHQDPGALCAIRAAGAMIGRGIAGLVNGMDPHLVVVGGLGPDLLRIAADEITAAYHDGLMAFRVTPPPPITGARLGADGPLLGAADEAFTRLLTDEGLQAWAAREQAARQADAPLPLRRETG